MALPYAEHLQRVVRGVVGGTDPARLLNEALRGAVAASGGRQGLLLGMVDGVPTPLASTGPVARVVLDAAEAAVATGRLARRGGSSGGSAVAEPLRVGPRVVGALAVGGDARSLDPAPLPLFADCASLALSRRPVAATTSAPAALDATAGLTTHLDRASVLVRLFDAAEALLGARGGLCALFEGDTIRVAQCRGVPLERLRAAARHPEFKALVTSPGLRVDPPSHPVVSQLVDGAECAVGLPLMVEARRLGHLVLLFGTEPDAPQRALLGAFARHAAHALRAADVYARLGDKEEQLSAVVHAVDRPVVVVDEAGRLVLVNGAATELFRLAGTFAVGQPVAGKLGHAELESLLADPGGGPAQLEVVAGDQPARTWRAAVRPIRSPEGRMLGRVLVMEDVTAERAAERAATDLVAWVGRGLRAPVAALREQVRRLAAAEEAGDTAGRREALRAVHDGTAHLERLVDDVVLATLLDGGHVVAKPAEDDLGEVVREVAVAAGPRVRFRRRGAPPVLAFDRALIERVVLHLVDNALRYSTGPVEVTVEGDDDAVSVAVADSGPGILSSDLPALFEGLAAPQGHDGGGVGLGLSICRRLVELHGGRIWCESRVGHGSRFAFALPRERAAAHPAEPEVQVALDPVAADSAAG